MQIDFEFVLYDHSTGMNNYIAFFRKTILELLF